MRSEEVQLLCCFAPCVRGEVVNSRTRRRGSAPSRGRGRGTRQGTGPGGRQERDLSIPPSPRSPALHRGDVPRRVEIGVKRHWLRCTTLPVPPVQLSSHPKPSTCPASLGEPQQHSLAPRPPAFPAPPSPATSPTHPAPRQAGGALPRMRGAPPRLPRALTRSCSSPTWRRRGAEG